MILKKIIKGIGTVPLVILGGQLIIYFFFLPPVLKYVIENQGEKRPVWKVDFDFSMTGRLSLTDFAMKDTSGGLMAYLQESMNNYPFDSYRINHISG